MNSAAFRFPKVKDEINLKEYFKSLLTHHASLYAIRTLLHIQPEQFPQNLVYSNEIFMLIV